jgi:hypothetical protein
MAKRMNAITNMQAKNNSTIKPTNRPGCMIHGRGTIYGLRHGRQPRRQLHHRMMPPPVRSVPQKDDIGV